MSTRHPIAKPAEPADESSPRFEQALERLEAIVTEMEDSDLDLETMIARFEEGRRHLAFCSRKLNEVERRIEILVKQDDGVTLAPFDPESIDANDADSPDKPRIQDT